MLRTRKGRPKSYFSHFYTKQILLVKESQNEIAALTHVLVVLVLVCYYNSASFEVYKFVRS